MPMGMGGGFDSSGPSGMGADAFGGGVKSSRVSFYMDDNNPLTFSNSPPAVNYDGRWGTGYATANPAGVGWGFNPSFDPNVSIQGQNFDVTGLGYSVRDRDIDPRVGVSLNLRGSRGHYDPSIGVEAHNLFGVEGLNAGANYGSRGYGGMLSYGGQL